MVGQEAADQGELAPGSLALPIKDDEHVEQRRAAMGMQPYAQYKAMLLRE